ncbi:MAG: FAD-dependent oxidoreductase [bacterium]
MSAPDHNGKVGSALVVGGGIAGMQAALDLADSGIKVHLVEAKPGIGGVMSQLDKTFPTNDCAMCTMAPRLAEIARHKDIEIHTLSEVDRVEGGPGNFAITINQRARYIKQDKCTGCGECAEACPIQVSDEFDKGLAQRKAIYKLYPQTVPGAFAIDKRGEPACALACPAGVAACGYVTLIARGKFKQALALERENNPLPAICGRICPHPCEKECRRGQLDQPVAIAHLKRFLADWEAGQPYEPPTRPAEERPERFAVVGAGPGGLTCAYYLRRKGYQVTLFEKEKVAGGMLVNGIPAYRLPRNIVEREVKWILDHGIELRLGTPVGVTGRTIQDLFNERYEAVFLATGAHKGVRLNLEGEADHSGIVDAVAYLHEYNQTGKSRTAGKVLVVGGGNSAIDAARTALRLGAEKVTVVYRRSRREMPANVWEIEDAEREGVRFVYLAGPVQLLGKGGKITGLRCVRMKLGEPDASGRRRPVPVKGSEFNLSADLIIPAVSQEADLDYLPMDFKRSKWGTLEVDPVTRQTNIERVFAGGDCVLGPATAVEAIAAAKEAATSMDRLVRGEDLKAGREPRKAAPAEKDLTREAKKSRISMPTLAINQRVGNFDEVELGYTEEQAKAEAGRCVQCATCCGCLECVAACEARAVDHQDVDKTIRLNVGAVVLAPGYESYDARLKNDLGYGRYANVITAPEFERILSASGPFQGHVVRPSDKKPPKRVAFIQCVGSRDAENDYCSSICCMYATKEAIVAKEHCGSDLACDIYFMDMRAFGKGFEAYYKRALAQGVRYIRCRPPGIEELPETGNLVVKYLSEDERKTSSEYDMVVLSTGLCAPRSARELSRTFGVELNEFNFCKTSTFRPVESSRDGVLVCGPFTEPKDIPETVMQASGAAGKVLRLLKEVRGALIVPKEYPPEIDVSGQEPRVGVFVCHCGSNIAGVVDVPSVVEYARTLPNVVYAENNLYTCSTDTQERLKEKIREHGLNRVVVASCSPRTHEPLFRNTCREQGLNPYLFEMANIRDHCSWVHMSEHEKATRKARDLVRIAVAKARLLEPLAKGSAPMTKSALVVGAGLSGMVSALDLAEQGYDVFLVEKEKDLGGNLRRIRYVLGAEDPAAELQSLVESVRNHGRIRLFAGAKIESIEGSIGSFTTKIAVNGSTHEVRHGVVIVATGAKEYRPKEYLYGEDDRVITQLELEHRLASDRGNGMTGNIVMIQCVGSRDEERPYCSRVCCAEAVKNALKLKEQHPAAHVYVLYRDIRTYGFKESAYTRARKEGVVFIRYEETRKPSVARRNGSLEVTVYDAQLHKKLSIEAGLVVLSAGIVPHEENKEIAQFLKVPLTQDGYFLEAHMKLRPVDFATDGVFLAGLAHSAKSIDESIIQAGAASARAGVLLSRDHIELEANVSHVIDDNCDGCAYCVDPCPFKAITLLEYASDGAVKKTVDVNESICKGCGVCQATCPKQGIFVKGFKFEQIAAQVAAALSD